MKIVIDFVDELPAMPSELSSDQMIIDFDGRKVIRTERNDGMFGGAFVKLTIPMTDIQYISSTMTDEELRRYMTTKCSKVIH